MLAAFMICGIFLTSCSNDDEQNAQPSDEVEAQLQQMTLREKVGQLFFIRPEVLDPSIEWETPNDLKAIQLQEVKEKMKSINEQYPIGGIVLYAWNINDETQLSRFISQIRALNGNPLLCIDEEGGLLARIAKNPNFNVKKYESS